MNQEIVLEEKNNNNIIQLKNVSLEIPLFSRSDFSLKKKLIKSVTGGVFKKDRNKSYVKA